MRWLKWVGVALLAWWVADALGSDRFALVVLLTGAAGWLLYRGSQRIAALEEALKATQQRLDRLESGSVSPGVVVADTQTDRVGDAGVDSIVDERGFVMAQPSAAVGAQTLDVPLHEAIDPLAADAGAAALSSAPGAVARASLEPDGRAASTPTPSHTSTSSAQDAADERAPSVTSSIGQSVLAWFRGGNTIVRVAVLILFIGVAFLLRYAAEHATLPIEYRIAAVALGGLALAAVGWRLRHTRRGYGLSLQGAGVGVLYLCIFAAFRLYGLLPAGLAFGLLIGMAAVTALLSVLQNALPLAVLGFSGGFLAPVLASTGQGSHVALFGYYLVLNVAIAWIASRQAWKLLNLVGFVFTFSIGAVWGANTYRPELFATTEPFLVAHFLLYLWISVQYSKRLTERGAPPGLPYVDGGLLFGVPIAAFGLQAALVRDMPYALALSSAALSGIYLVLGRWLWQRGGEQLRLLTEGLLALGVVFLILVTPLALDARWTGAAWALQGAGIVWIGLRQHRHWAAAMGLLLQLAAAASFWDAHVQGRDAEATLVVFANVYFIGATLLAVSALFTARLLHRHAAAMPSTGPVAIARALHWLMMLVGLGQALGGVGAEWQRVLLPAWDSELRLSLMLAAFTLLLEGLHMRLRWPELSVPARVLIVTALAVSLTAVASDAFSPASLWRGYTEGFGWLELAVLLAVGVWLQRRLARPDAADRSLWRRPLAAEGLALAWYATAQGSVLLYSLMSQLVARHEAWTPLAALLLPTLLAWWLLSRTEPARWPVAGHTTAWRVGYFMPLLVLQGLWTLGVNAFADGGMAPLPYVPLLNPIDLGHGLLALYAVKLWRVQGLGSRFGAKAWRVAAGAVAFCWSNSLIVRSLHHWAGTPMWESGALDAGLVQTSLTIAWTVMALATMWWATRRAAPDSARPLWLCGAGLLAVVVLKLFLVDLSNIGTLERIVSFLGVGGLMLVIGYVSPMPPARSAPSVPDAAS